MRYRQIQAPSFVVAAADGEEEAGRVSSTTRGPAGRGSAGGEQGLGRGRGHWRWTAHHGAVPGNAAAPRTGCGEPRRWRRGARERARARARRGERAHGEEREEGRNGDGDGDGMRTGNEDWMRPWGTQIDDACMQSEDGPPVWMYALGTGHACHTLLPHLGGPDAFHVSRRILI